MDYCIVNVDGIIENIIVCEDDAAAAEFGAVPSYDGASIGAAYEPPPAPDPEPTTEDRVAALEAENVTIKEQLQQADDTAIELYEANMAQEEINAAQDDALIEIYELIGG